MSRFGTYLGRFAAIVFGYALAALCASLVLNTAFLGAMGLMAPDIPHSGLGLWVSVPFAALFIGYYGFIPGMALIAIGEATARRGWLYYALGGAAVAAIVTAPILADPDAGALYGAAPDGPDTGLAALFIAAGIAAGIAYWLAAGRNAGLWLARASASRPTSGS